MRVGIGNVKAILGDSVSTELITKALWASRGDVGSALNILLDSEATRELRGFQAAPASDPAPPVSVPLPTLATSGGTDGVCERYSGKSPATCAQPSHQRGGDGPTRPAVPHAVTPPPPVTWSPMAAPMDDSAAGHISAAMPATIAATSEGRGVDSWPKLLGTVHLQGLCLTRLRAGDVTPGEELVLKRATQAAAPTKAKTGKSGGKPGKGAVRPSPFSTGAGGGIAPKNTIIRFSSASGSELGRLPSDLADCLAPLLDERKATARLTSCPLPAAGLGESRPVIAHGRSHAVWPHIWGAGRVSAPQGQPLTCVLLLPQASRTPSR